MMDNGDGHTVAGMVDNEDGLHVERVCSTSDDDNSCAPKRLGRWSGRGRGPLGTTLPTLARAV
jgi:hypothetical protein